jgi:hypothetical protein
MARRLVEQEIFLFHPERVHARNNRPGGTWFRNALSSRKNLFLLQNRPPDCHAAAADDRFKRSGLINSLVCRTAMY